MTKKMTNHGTNEMNGTKIDRNFMLCDVIPPDDGITMKEQDPASILDTTEPRHGTVILLDLVALSQIRYLGDG